MCVLGYVQLRTGSDLRMFVLDHIRWDIQVLQGALLHAQIRMEGRKDGMSFYAAKTFSNPCR